MCTITDKINKIEGADVRFTYDPLMWLPGNFTTNSQTITSTSESGRQVVLTTKYKLSSTYKKLIQATWHACGNTYLQYFLIFSKNLITVSFLCNIFNFNF